MKFKRFFMFVLLVSIFVITFPLFSAKKQTKQEESKSALWFKDLFFKDASLNFEAIGVLSLTYSQGADIGETVATVRNIDPNNISSWYESWKATGNRLKKNADNYLKNGHVQSARTAYFRACIYLWKSGFYSTGTENTSKAVDAYKTAIECFKQAINTIPNIKAVSIPYKKSSLPGYLLISKNADRPLPVLIVNNGFDGTKELSFFEVGREALSRGYNCLIFEGPGQGEAVWGKNLYFTHKWEEPVKAAIDYLENCKDIKISKIALMGRSMGGYLAPRAAAFDKRIDACIANGGLYDLAGPMLKIFPPKLLQLMKEKPNEFNKVINGYLKQSKSIETNWFFSNGMWAFGVKTPAEFLSKIQKYTLKGVTGNITCPTLIVDTTQDMFAGNQAKMLYDKLKCKKEYMLFGKNDNGELHCQLGALAVSNERIFNWLDTTLNFNIQK